MKHLAIAIALLALGACGHDKDHGVDAGPSGNGLVQSLIVDNTTDSAEPVDVNDLELQFSEDANAFSGLFD